ncbi:MAG TPA: diadenylate cyclase [Pirellulaceae bacterium]|nr:diadenylate cyclase [Pirellulaceae bacterium]
MQVLKLGKQFVTMFDLAARLAADGGAEAVLILVEGSTDWEQVKQKIGDVSTIVAVEHDEQFLAAQNAGLRVVQVRMQNDTPIFEKLAQSVLECVSEELLTPGATVVTLYSSFDADDRIDSMSVIELDEHLGRLSARDLRQLETSVPLETLREVVDLAVEIGREGREGKPVGTMFVVGDTRKVLSQCHEAGFDPVKGYSRNERNLHNPRIRESIKEVAQLDGAFIVASDGTVERAAQLIDTSPVSLTLSKGLGSRHWSAAAISKNTKAIAIVVSESTGTVRIFQNGEVVLHIEPFRRAMKWKGFEYDPPAAGAE